MKADLFQLGNLIDVDDLRLGVEQYQDQEPCRATASAAGDEYRIFAALSDCGTKNLVIYLYIYIYIFFFSSS